MCRDIVRSADDSQARDCSELLPFRRESIGGVVTTYIPKDGDHLERDAVVCGNCFGLVGKIDQVSFELDIYVEQLRSRAKGT